MPPATTTSTSPGADELIGERDGIEAGQTYLIDGDRGHLLRNARLDRRLARGDLARAGLQDLTHDHVIHVAGLDAGPFHGSSDRMGAEGNRRQIFESSPKLAERCARARYDHR